MSGAIGGRHLGCLVALRQLPWPTSPAVCEGTKVHAYADQQQSLQGSASFTPMLVQTERHPAGLAAPRAGHGSRQKRHEDTAKLGACHKSELSARMLGCRLLVTAPSHPTRIRYPSGHLQRAKRRLDRLACLDHRDGPPGAAAVVAQHQLQVARGGCACCSGPAVEVGSASRRAVEAAASAGQPRGKPWLAPWNSERIVRFIRECGWQIATLLSPTPLP